MRGSRRRNEHWVNRWRAEAQTVGSGSTDGGLSEDGIFSLDRTEDSASVKRTPRSIATRTVTIAIQTKKKKNPLNYHVWLCTGCHRGSEKHVSTSIRLDCFHSALHLLVLILMANHVKNHIN